MNLQEIWKSVDGYPNTEVSNLGNLRSLFRGVIKPRATYVNKNGYEMVGLQNKSERKHKRVHVLVSEAFIGPKDKNMDVNHIDGNKLNNTLDNLEYMSRSDNCKHAFRLGLSYTPFRERGESHCRSILSNSDVLSMRDKFSHGETRRNLATEFCVSYYTVWDITERRSWTHI